MYLWLYLTHLLLPKFNAIKEMLFARVNTFMHGYQIQCKKLLFYHILVLTSARHIEQSFNIFVFASLYFAYNQYPQFNLCH